jgi:preprotein translocase subunit SecG
MQVILLVLHVMLAVALVVLILIQHGRGADMGAAFGAGASGTVFGARGAGTFLSRSTAILAALFFITSMGLAYVSTMSMKGRSVADQFAPAAPTETVTDVPAAPAEPAGDVPAIPSE